MPTTPEISARPVVLFDLDGTLANTKPGIIATARAALSAWGMGEEEMGDLGRLIGPAFPYAYCDIYGVSRADAEEITRLYRERYARLGREAYPLFGGMAELLADLRAQGRVLAVASSKRRDFVERILADDGVAHLFSHVSASMDAAHADKPTLIREALRALSARPEDAVMVGDRFYDVAGAREVGVPCVGVLFGTATREELEGAGAAQVVTSVDELRRALVGGR